MSSSSYTHIVDTVLSPSALLGSLSGNDIRALNFADAIANKDALQPSLTASATTNTDLTIPNLIQAATSRQLVTSGTISTDNQRLSLLPDTLSAAHTYIKLFNLSSTDYTGPTKRVLTFQNCGVATATQNILLGVASGAGSSSVQVTINSASGSVSTQQTLFAAGSAPAGRRSVVTVYATNTSSASAHVVFDVAVA